ncbi:unnamed protein product [Tetraodon nigroviridis]|uniref:(spotted green pufferfish) hypothetical protein n=1 Tax=Tetraodon nigroviridis TaxID=99883 RepID=Q4S4P1_TETNG|nr:unnamed protein product [Tetraodon nigroviridis]
MSRATLWAFSCITSSLLTADLHLGHGDVTIKPELQTSCLRVNTSPGQKPRRTNVINMRRGRVAKQAFCTDTLTDPESIKTCIKECEARIEIGLHYKNPYPRAIYLPPRGLATQKGRKLRAQQRLRKQAKPIYLESQDQS